MLNNKLFYVENMEQEDGMVKAAVTLEARHKIFEGHFPGQPVLPGVCMLQMIKEILESVTGARLRLSASDYLKFLSMIDPRVTSRLEVSLQHTTVDNQLQTIASLASGSTTFFKMKAAFTITP